MTVQEVAKELGCSIGLVYRLCAERKIDHHRIGVRRGIIRITPAQLDQYKRSTEVAAKDETETPKAVRKVRGLVIPDYIGEYERRMKNRLTK